MIRLMPNSFYTTEAKLHIYVWTLCSTLGISKKKRMHKMKQKINIKAKQLCIKIKSISNIQYPDYILYLIILDFTELKLGSLLLFALQKFQYH